MSELTTHILDIANGIPAQGVRVDLIRLNAEGRTHLKTLYTNANGQTDQALLTTHEMAAGEYEMRFFLGAYFSKQPPQNQQPSFYNEVPVCFYIADESQHFHVPLLISPWSYSTYRGS